MATVELNGHTEVLPGGTNLVADARTTPRRGLLGELLIREGLITEAQLQQALSVQRSEEQRTPLGQILVRLEVITQRQLNQVLDRYRKKYRLGDILVETEAITDDQLQIALDHQKKTGLRLGDVLLQLNFVTEEEVNKALCTQFGVTFVDLDRLILDRDVAALIDKRFAQQHRVIPIAKTENIIVLAMDDPSSLEVVAQLEAMTRCKINVVTSTHAAFQRAFTRAYGESPEAGFSRQHEDLRKAYDRLYGEYEASVRELAETRGGHRDLLREREAGAQRLRELADRNELNTQGLAELRAAHDGMRREYEATNQELLALRERYRGTVEALAELEAAHTTLREERETTRLELDELEARHHEALRELEAEREALAREREAVARTLREGDERHQAVLADWQAAAGELEELLSRLKPLPRLSRLG